MTMTVNKKYNRHQVIISLALVLVISFLLMYPLPQAYATTYTENSPEVIANREKIDQIQKEIAQAQEQRKALESEIDDASASASEIQDQVNALQTEVNAYQKQIDALNKQINLLNSQITETEKSITETEAQIATQEEKISETRQVLGERIRAMYMAGNVSSVELILEADSFENLLTRLELVAQISKHDNAIIEELKDAISKLEKMKSELEEKKTSLEADKKEIEASKADVVAMQNEVKAAKSAVDAKLKKIERYLNSLENSDKQLAALQAKAEAQREAYEKEIEYMLNGHSQGNGSASLIWPVPYSSSYISSGFGPRSLGSSSIHYGLDITMPGADSWDKKIIAAGSGTVLIATNSCSHNYRKNYNCGCNGGYGRYVVIDHGNGVLAWYGHMASVSVSVGQTVSQGQTIGYMGCTGYSTGPHLHFEIRVGSGSRASTAVNPLKYVSKP